MRSVTLDLGKGEFVCVLGANGAGKSSLLGCLSGINAASSGTVELNEQDVTSIPAYERVRLGLGQVPERRQLFSDMSVLENLLVGGATRRNRLDRTRRIQAVFELFPILFDRSKQRAGSLSGGEQQMLAVGRALMSGPKILMLDEPSMGLAPAVVDKLFGALSHLNDEGLTILLVEQNLNLALKYAKRGYVLERGSVVAEGQANELATDDRVRAAYMGTGNIEGGE